MQKKILLVEDEAIIALNFKKMIEKHSYKVNTAKNGEEAVRETANDPEISLVLMDINLGKGIDGTEAAKRILQDREIPIVFLTSYSDKGTVDKVKNIARYGYVPKNLGEFVLIEAINMAYELFEANQKIKAENREKRRAEKHLLERNRFIETIMDSIPVGLSVHSFDRDRFSYMNREFTDIHGWPKEDITNIRDFIQNVFPDPEYRKHMSSRILNLLKGKPEELVWDDVQIVRKNGDIRTVNIQNIPLYDQKQIISVVQDTTEQKRMEAALKESEQKYRTLYENAPIPYQSLDQHGFFLEVNPAWLTALGGYSQNDVIGKSFAEFLHPDWVEHFRQNFPVFKQRGNISGVQFRMRKKDGTYIDTLFQGCIGFSPTGDVKQTHCIFRDITGRRRIETERDEVLEELEGYRERLEGTMRAGNIAWWEMHVPSGTVDFNEQKTRMLGYEKEQFKTCHDFTALIHPDDLDSTMKAMTDCLQGKTDTYKADYRIRTRENDYKWFHDIGAVSTRGLNGMPLKVTGVVVDISEIKEYEITLKKMLAEKDFLVREIFHRVKNNLAMVYSLVALKESQSGYRLTDIKNQIQTIRIIYEQLQHQKTDTHIEFGTYLSDLLETIFSMHSMPVHLEKRMIQMYIPTADAVPVGTAVNEIATNAVKHGFRVDEEACFSITMSRDPDTDTCIIELTNSGNPFPDAVDFDSGTTLGLRLIRELTNQVGGTITLEKTPQPLYTIRFPVSAKNPAAQ